MAIKVPTVADLLEGKSDKIFVVKESASLRDAAAALARRRIGILLVVGETKGFRGILSERDLVKAMAVHGSEATTLKVGDVATHTVRACSADRTLASVLDSMKSGHFRHMPVVDGEKIRGVISITDILEYLSRTNTRLRQRAVPARSRIKL